MHVSARHLEIWETPLPTPEQFHAWDPLAQMRFLAMLGHLAPSSHNTQPWRFQVNSAKQTITISVDRARVLPESDVVGRQTAVSIGCVIENIVVGAEALGMSVAIEILPIEKAALTPGKKEFERTLLPIAILTLSPGAPITPAAIPLSAIRSRKVLRTEFDPTKEIDARTLGDIDAAMGRFPGVTLHAVSDAIHRLAIAEFQGQADGYVLNKPRFARELGAWLYGNTEERGDGMPGNTFGFDDEQAERIHAGLLGERPLEPEDMLRFSLGGKVGFEKSPVIGFLTTANDEIADRINAGRVLEHLWLMLESRGYAVAIHAAIVEVRLINRIFATTLGTTEPLAAVFRTGKPLDTEIKEKRPHSPRLPVDEVLEIL